MHIEAVLFAPGHGAFFTDDQASIKDGARKDGFVYSGAPMTAGFSAIRMPAAALGIGLRLCNGAVIWGDMMTVQYAGAGGREAPLDAMALQKCLQSELVPALIGLELDSFQSAIRGLFRALPDGCGVPNSAKYGLSQALLAAVARNQGCSMAEVICKEYGFPVVVERVPIYCQSGEDRYGNVDKMILRRVDALPHGLINSPRLIGRDGVALSEYVVWVRDRILQLGGPDYRPWLHFDV